jgi:hypothetical protein
VKRANRSAELCPLWVGLLDWLGKRRDILLSGTLPLRCHNKLGDGSCQSLQRVHSRIM